ncbi:MULTISPECIES: FecCD family ABC transporter permease [Chromohalobacter]|uniref:FecCD family ABC transporter permease n=1 Tax=Chromohalobacter TaxID=42054 RepID=UPI000D713FF0|nr:iron ABC transporter permease [Chromohalobacter salexigens]MDO0947163.1 iron ABC transporter permease [Chromohalobacter salexigens]NWO57465.1 iron-siderophore ABC transporter permease [Chromohalobacter salexigens]PWW37803.1 iron complex transport system permease protein [Chromohalobacter salexigens]
MTHASPATANADSVTRYRARRRHQRRLIAGLAVLTLGMCLADIATGPGQYPLQDILAALVAPGDVSQTLRVIVWDIRLPVALMAVLVGVSLASAGAEMQTILNNPLADPFTLGISSAASVGAALAITLGVSVIPLAQPLWVTGNAFLMALGASLFIWGISRLRGVSVQTLVLMGIAVMFFFNAMLGLMQYVASAEALQQLVFWSLGSLGKASWDKVGLIAAALLVTLPIFLHAGWRLTALRLGDMHAKAMGIDVARLRLRMLLCCSLLAAMAVAFVGTVGFVGLVGPHIARLLVGEDQRVFLPVSALSGALIMSLTSILSKTLVPGILLPIGILTALIGLPFFVSLILRSRREVWG